MVNYANDNGFELYKRDVEQVAPYEDLLALGGDANLIPYLYDAGQLIQGNDEIIAYLEQR